MTGSPPSGVTPGCAAAPPVTGKATVATVAAREPLRPVPPTPYPLLLTESRVVSRQALVGYRGNFYSVPPELAAATVTVSRLVGAPFCDIATSTGIVVARHRLAPDGAGVVVRDHGHVAALDAVALKAAAARPRSAPPQGTHPTRTRRPGRRRRPARRRATHPQPGHRPGQPTNAPPTEGTP